MLFIKTRLYWLDFRFSMLKDHSLCLYISVFPKILQNFSNNILFPFFSLDKIAHNFGLDLRVTKLCLVEQITSIGKHFIGTILKWIDYTLWTKNIERRPLGDAYFESMNHPVHPDYEWENLSVSSTDDYKPLWRTLS